MPSTQHSPLFPTLQDLSRRTQKWKHTWKEIDSSQRTPWAALLNEPLQRLLAFNGNPWKLWHCGLSKALAKQAWKCSQTFTCLHCQAPPLYHKDLSSHWPDSRQVIRICTKHWPWREHSWLKLDPGKKDITANGIRNIVKKQLRHHFCHKASFTSSITQDYPASPFSASCPGLRVSLGILISPRTAFGFIHFCVRQLGFYRYLAPLRKEWHLFFVVSFVQLVSKHLFQSLTITKWQGTYLCTDQMERQRSLLHHPPAFPCLKHFLVKQWRFAIYVFRAGLQIMWWNSSKNKQNQPSLSFQENLPS